MIFSKYFFSFSSYLEITYYYSANFAETLLITLGVPVAALIDADYVIIEVPEALPVADILLADYALVLELDLLLGMVACITDEF